MELPDLADQYRLFGRATGRDGTPLYEQICSGIADDPFLLDLTAQAPSEQRRPNLLLAAVHYLLLAGSGDPLADFYPTVADWRGRAGSTIEGRNPSVEFAAFCRRHRLELAALLASRATQTNEVGRCAALLPAFVTVAAGARAPLALIDLGASAGLNLLFDRYAYRYSDRAAGTTGSPVLLDCQVRSGLLPDLSLPAVAHRDGLDQRPLDVASDEDARWLLACQWPHHLERFRRLRAAIDLARATPERGRVRTGDMVDDLPPLAAQVPPDAHLCLYHSWAAAYLPAERQTALATAVAQLAQRRPLSWVYLEQPYEVPGLPMPEGPEKIKGASALVLVEAPGPEQRAHRLADLHPHGRWLHWWGA